MRWAMIQLAWRLVGRTAYWRGIFAKLERRIGKKKAVVAVARRVFCVIVSMLRSGQGYRTPRGEATTGFRRDGKGVRGEEKGRKRAERSRATKSPKAMPQGTLDREAKPRKKPRASSGRPRHGALSAHP